MVVKMKMGSNGVVGRGISVGVGKMVLMVGIWLNRVWMEERR